MKKITTLILATLLFVSLSVSDANALVMLAKQYTSSEISREEFVKNFDGKLPHGFSYFFINTGSADYYPFKDIFQIPNTRGEYPAANVITVLKEGTYVGFDRFKGISFACTLGPDVIEFFTEPDFGGKKVTIFSDEYTPIMQYRCFDLGKIFEGKITKTRSMRFFKDRPTYSKYYG